MKREILSAAILAAVLFVPAFSHAAKKPAAKSAEPMPSKWIQEPDGFVGIKFGVPFPSSVPDCPMTGRYVDFDAVRRLQGVCFEGDSRNSYGKLWNTPDLGIPYSVSVTMDRGVPTMFVIDTRPEYFVGLKDALVKRYGKPTTTIDGKVQSGGGGEFDNQTNRWVGDRVTIESYMRHDEVGKSQTFISDRVYWKQQQDEADKKSAAGASQL